MAAALSRACGAALLRAPAPLPQVAQLSSASGGMSRSRRYLFTTLGVVTGGVGALWIALEQSVKASSNNAAYMKNPWTHLGLISSYDHASIRRGYEVYKQVCAACHSMKYLAYRNLVGISHTEAEAKVEAAEAMIEDGPDEIGNFFKRPGKLSDYFPSPYPNEEAARAANNGAYPPDLSYIVGARKGGEDYIFALLTGYMDPPAGVIIQEGQYYNPYFPGGALSMAQALYNEAMEYTDGTPATQAQLAKDVCTFLKWASEPDLDDRRRMFVKFLGYSILVTSIVYYVYRAKWTVMKSRKIAFKPKQ